MKSEVILLQKRLGQEEHYSKELSVLNNKLQTNMTTQGFGSFARGSEVGAGNTKIVKNKYNFYGGDHNMGESEDDSDEELQKRRNAQA